jgi:hypothetical protein
MNMNLGRYGVELSFSLIIGSGIKSTEQINNSCRKWAGYRGIASIRHKRRGIYLKRLKDVFNVGTDIVVVGNVFETQPTLISEFIDCAKVYGVILEP